MSKKEQDEGHAAFAALMRRAIAVGEGGALENEIATETEALVAYRVSRPFARVRRTSALVRAEHERARDFYVAEINALLAADTIDPLVPYDVLHRRRKPFCWALATLIREVEDRESPAYRAGLADGLDWDLSGFDTWERVERDRDGWDTATLSAVGVDKTLASWGVAPDATEEQRDHACRQYNRGAHEGATSPQSDRTGAPPQNGGRE